MTTETTSPSRRRVAPPADILETDGAYRILLDLPGVDEDEIDVAIERNVLTVRASAAVTEPSKLAQVWREYEPVDYQRSFTLGAGIDRERVQAAYRDGVLTLDLPKAEEQKPRRIAVSSN